MMRPDDREQLLWNVSEIEGTTETRKTGTEPGDEPVSDDVLHAFRRGALDAEDEARVTRQLARQPSLRRRLLTLSELEPPAAPARILDRLIARPTRARRWRTAALLAAALVAVLVGWRLLRPEITLPMHSVTIAALAADRDGPKADTRANAYAETLVTIDAIVMEKARAGVDLALYRSSNGTLTRVVENNGVVRTENRGAVRWQGSAQRLVGPTPGDYAIFVVVAQQGDLLDTIALPREHDSVSTLSAGGRRRVHRLPLRLLPNPSETIDVGTDALVVPPSN